MFILCPQLADVQRLVWQTEGAEARRSPFERSAEEIATSRESFAVTISPMQIRTWLCTYTIG